MANEERIKTNINNPINIYIFTFFSKLERLIVGAFKNNNATIKMNVKETIRKYTEIYL